MEILMTMLEKGYVAFVVYASFMFWISSVKIVIVNKKSKIKRNNIVCHKNNGIYHIISNEMDIRLMIIEMGY